METESPNPRVMKRYVVGVACSFVAVFAALWLWVIVAPMAYLDPDYPIWLAKMRMAQSGQLSGVVILGDSRPTAGLIPERIGRDVVNLGLSGGSPIDCYYQARSVVQGAARPRAIILSITPGRFMLEDLFWRRSSQFGLLDYGQIEEVRRRARELKEDTIFGKASPFDLDARLQDFLYPAGFPTYRFPSLLAGGLFTRYWANKNSFARVISSRGQAYFGTKDGFYWLNDDTRMQDFVPSSLLDDYFNRTLVLFESLNIPVYFLSMPHNEVSVRAYNQQMEQKFSDYLRHISTRHPNFHILGEMFPSYSSKYFGDPDHLNPSGAKLWSDTVAKMLNDANVPGGPFGPN